MQEHHYRHLALMAVLSFVAMYALMYAMVNSSADVYMNVNQVYMAALMAAPMIPIEILVMRTMYRDKRMNALLVVASLVLGVVMFAFTRQQTAVSDRQFLRSMIPHHSGAILMCERASLRDAQVLALCKDIIAGQRAEIEQMAAKLDQLR